MTYAVRRLRPRKGAAATTPGEFRTLREARAQIARSLVGNGEAPAEREARAIASAVSSAGERIHAPHTGAAYWIEKRA